MNTTVGYVVGVLINIIMVTNFIRDAKNSVTLFVGVHTDVFVESYKRKPFDNEEKRYENIKNSQLADEIVIIGDDHGSLIRKYKVTKMFHGDDWEINSYKKQIKYYEDGLDKLGVELILLPYTKGI